MLNSPVNIWNWRHPHSVSVLKPSDESGVVKEKEVALWGYGVVGFNMLKNGH